MIYDIASRVRIIVLRRKQPVVVTRTLHTRINIIVRLRSARNRNLY